MPRKRPWIVLLGAVICVALALTGSMFPPLNTQNIWIMYAYELSMIVSVFLVLLMVYKKGFTE